MRIYFEGIFSHAEFTNVNFVFEINKQHLIFGAMKMKQNNL